jgi:hypothetical protein
LVILLREKPLLEFLVEGGDLLDGTFFCGDAGDLVFQSADFYACF